MPATPKAVVRSCGGRPTPVDFTFTGVGFTDGAVRGGPHSRSRRAGWSAVLVSSGGEVVHGFYGSCPDAFPTSLRAELWGLIKILELALPPLTVYVDNAGVVGGVRKGQEWCTAAARPAADLWRKVWSKLGDIGGGIVVLKCKGHATAADIMAGRATALTKAGNDHADFFAGQGAIIAEHDAPAQHIREAYSEARRWSRWLAELAAHWPADAETRQPKLSAKPAIDPVAEVRSDKAPWRTHHESPHKIVEAAGRLTCEVCLRFANADTARSHRAAFAKSACKGSLPDLAREQAKLCREPGRNGTPAGPSKEQGNSGSVDRSRGRSRSRSRAIARGELTLDGKVEGVMNAQERASVQPEKRAAWLAACIAACKEPVLEVRPTAAVRQAKTDSLAEAAGQAEATCQPEVKRNRGPSNLSSLPSRLVQSGTSLRISEAVRDPRMVASRSVLDAVEIRAADHAADAIMLAEAFGTDSMASEVGKLAELDVPEAGALDAGKIAEVSGHAADAVEAWKSGRESLVYGAERPAYSAELLVALITGEALGPETDSRAEAACPAETARQPEAKHFRGPSNLSSLPSRPIQSGTRHRFGEAVRDPQRGHNWRESCPGGTLFGADVGEARWFQFEGSG